MSLGQLVKDFIKLKNAYEKREIQLIEREERLVNKWEKVRGKQL